MSIPPLPKWAIILDVFGALLVAGGIFLLVSQDELRGLAIGMLVVGGMLMVPLIAWAVRRATARH